MMRRQIVFNALTTFAQVIGSAAMLFFLYRFLIRTIGLERLGIWSLVLATTSSSRWRTRVSDQHRQTRSQIRSPRSSPGCLAAHADCGHFRRPCARRGLHLPVSGARWILEIVLPRRSLAEALAILPPALLSLWLKVLEGVLQAGLAGLQRITVCNYLEFGGSLSYLLLAWTLFPRHGLLGLACAQAIQSAAILLITWFSCASGSDTSRSSPIVGAVHFSTSWPPTDFIFS